MRQALRAAPYATGYVLAAGAVFGYWMGGWWFLQPAVWVFVIVPGADLFLPKVPLDEPDPSIARSRAFSFVLWMWVPTQLTLIAWGLWQVRPEHATWPVRLETALSVGVCCGAMGMNFGHELLHRRSRFERALAEILMTSMTYPQLCVEHLVGHHHDYGKPCDYATARFGESYYHAMLRCIRGSLVTTWRAERSRLRRRGLGPFHPGNRMLRYGATLFLLYALVGRWFGAGGLVFYLVQSAIAIAMLHAVNYTEHYGLTRREIAPGAYEPPGSHLSWDAPGQLTNLFAINIQNHAHHHRAMFEPYQVLHPVPATPRLPASYGLMMVLAVIPPLWRAVMDPRVIAWRQAATDAWSVPAAPA